MNILKIILLLFLSIFIASAKDICILDENSKIEECKENILYFIDKNSEYIDPLKIPQENFKHNNKKTFLGHILYPIWSKLTITYKGEKEKSFVFVNPKVTINNLTVNVFDENKNLIKKEILGDLNPLELRELKSRYSAFKLILKPNETISIITQIKHTGASDISWLTLPLNIFENFIIKESTIIGILIGILIAIIFYNLILYIRLKDKLYLLYLLHIICAFLFQVSTTNLFYEFNIILGGFFPWIIASLGIGSLIIFAKYFFNTKKYFPKINKFINLMIIICLSLSIYFTIAIFYPQLMEYRKLIVFPLITITTILMIILAISSLYKKHAGSFYYTMGQIGYLLCFMTPQFSNFLQAEFTFTVVYIGTFGILFDVFFLSLALSKKIEDMKTEKENNKKLLISQSRFASIGKSIATVSHQWKTPLAHISISLVNLESYLFKTRNNDNFLKEFSKNMRNSITFMSKTIDDINNFYLSQNNRKEEFYFIDITNFVTKLLEEKISRTKLKISLNIDESLKIETHKNILGNVLLILIDNSLDIFIKRKIHKPDLLIETQIDKNNLTIIIRDNAGGIKLKPIEKIFDDFISSKASSGLGLSIAKNLVEKQLKGKITVKNTSEGACFNINIPL